MEVIFGKNLYANQSADWLAEGIELTPEAVYCARIIAHGDESAYNDVCMCMAPMEPLENGVRITSAGYVPLCSGQPVALNSR